MELVVEDAEFVTMAPANRAESMLVRDGRITAIGPTAAVRAAAEPGAAVVRLDGATVIPGLIDAHCHVMNVGYLAAVGARSQVTDVHHVAVGVDQAGYHRGAVQPHHGGARFCSSAHSGGRANRGDPAIAHQHALGAAGGRHRNELGILDKQLHWRASPRSDPAIGTRTSLIPGGRLWLG